MKEAANWGGINDWPSGKRSKLPPDRDRQDRCEGNRTLAANSGGLTLSCV